MGRFSVEIELANNEDLTRAKDGTIPQESVRRTKLRGVVDSGASRLVLPEKAVRELGLPKSGKMTAIYADGRKAARTVVENVRVNLMGRSGVFTASVEPKRESALIGALVLEDLDLLIDPLQERLRPRDPKSILSYAE